MNEDFHYNNIKKEICAVPARSANLPFGGFTIKIINLKLIAQWLWPNYCLVCRDQTKRTLPLCDQCEKDLPWNHEYCFQCGIPLSEKSIVNLCGKCLTQEVPYDQTITLFHYQHPVDKWINLLKFHHQLIFAQLLGKILAHRIRRERDQNEFPKLIIPIPLHNKRLSERGFNQALEIARPISKILQIPIDFQNFNRIKNTKAQSSLSANERGQNIKKAFAIKKLIHVEHVAIIDDVITTTSTITEFSQLLKNAGVSKIEVWCGARASVVSSL